MNKLCARCGKPVYFAERKTSLGREWHPTCLKCHECGRVLTPGQHAEHKGQPYCHHPCYRALFGPDIIGFGSTVSQPKGRPTSCSLDYYDHNLQQQQHHHHHHQQHRRAASDNPTAFSSSSSKSNFTSYIKNDHLQRNAFASSIATDGLTTTAATTTTSTTTSLPGSIVTTTTTTSPATLSSSFDAATLKVRGLEPLSEEAGYYNTDSEHSERFNSNDSDSHIPNMGSNLNTKDIEPSPVITLDQPEVSNCDSDTLKIGETYYTCSEALNGIHEMTLVRPIPQRLAERVNAFNDYHQSKINSQMTFEQLVDGSVQVRGPLRIYWGLSRPIQLSHCDDKPAAPVSKWRHSLHVGNKTPDIPERKLSGTMSMRRPTSPSQRARDMDDLRLPTSSPDDVVRRKKKGVPKFKTVAYRGDEPMKWKRASINGHIFNYDTSVFTPVLGSCTCVNVTDNMDSMQVITTLLEKFKVQNNAHEYVLSLVSEEGERLLTNSDRPLLERLTIGPQETLGKLFIKERQMEAEVLPVDSHTHIQMPIVEAEEEENLPQEVEQLLVLPEAVLKGILVKYKKDEEHDVQLLKGRYEAARKRIRNRLDEISYKTSSTA